MVFAYAYVRNDIWPCICMRRIFLAPTSGPSPVAELSRSRTYLAEPFIKTAELTELSSLHMQLAYWLFLQLLLLQLQFAICISLIRSLLLIRCTFKAPTTKAGQEAQERGAKTSNHCEKRLIFHR